MTHLTITCWLLIGLASALWVRRTMPLCLAVWLIVTLSGPGLLIGYLGHRTLRFLFDHEL